MHENRSNLTNSETDAPCQENEHTQDSSDLQSFSLADATSLIEIEIQANQLLDYIDKLSSLGDRAGQNAIRPSESTQRIEDTRRTESGSSGGQLEPYRALLQERKVASAVLEKSSKVQIAELEKLLREREFQLSEREEELKHLRVEISCFVNRLKEAEESVKQNETRVQLHSEPLNQEVAELKLQLAKQEESIQAKNNALRKIDLDFRSKILELEQRLVDSGARLEQQEAKLKEKDALIHATAEKEAEVGKLINRLSTECGKLSVELQEKTRRLAQLEDKKSQPTDEGMVWRRVPRLQEQSS